MMHHVIILIWVHMLLQVLAWALEAPSKLCVHAYVGVVWQCMPLLVPRLDCSQRQAFCEVSLRLLHVFAGTPTLRLDLQGGFRFHAGRQAILTVNAAASID